MARLLPTDPGNLRTLADWLERQRAAGEQVERARIADEFRRMADAVQETLEAEADELPDWRI